MQNFHYLINVNLSGGLSINFMPAQLNPKLQTENRLQSKANTHPEKSERI